jgi:3-hydroxyisobutyrate dehydrogenase-like beta-hydroxyacid dehydrogenase
MTPLGFVGLGRMGAPMAARLAATGHQVFGFDAAGSADRVPDGVTPAESIGALAAAELVFLSLPYGAASQHICSSLAQIPYGQTRVVIDLSTIGMAAARSCAETLATADIAYVDAPVSGGVAGAQCGALSLMVACDSAHYRLVEPLLQALGKHCFHVGSAPGQGQAMKLLNNFVSATALAATSEATVFGVQAGLDLAQIIDVLNVSSGRTTASTDKFPRSVLPQRYDFGFAGALMTKDVQLYVESAFAEGAPNALAVAVAELWRRFDTACAGADFTYIHKFLENETAKRCL